MLFEMNMLLMYHAHHLTTEMEDKKPTKAPKSTLKILTTFMLYSKYRMSSITGKIIQFSAVVLYKALSV